MQATTLEFLQVAREIIDDFLSATNAEWVAVAEDTIPNPDEPWVTERGTETRTPVKIVFLQDQMEDRQFLRYLEGTNINVGQVNGIMYPYPQFTPSKKDIVVFNNEELAIKAIDPLTPIDEPIIYLLEFAT